MMWQLLTFEPVDVTVGADHRQLDDSGTSVDTELNPQAFAGALRTGILTAHGYNFGKPPEDQATKVLRQMGRALGVAFKGDVQTQKVSSDCFTLRGPIQYATGVAKSVSTFWPMPRSVVRDEYSNHLILLPVVRGEALCDGGLEQCEILTASAATTKPVNLPCRWDELLDYLQDGIAPAPAQTRDEPFSLYAIEMRMGHRRNEHGVPEDQALFGRESRRFRDSADRYSGTTRVVSGYAMLARIEPAWRPRDGDLLRLGSDGHGAIVGCQSAAELQTDVGNLKQAVVNHVGEGGGLLLYLGSPAIFNDGWRPPFGNTEGVRLVAAAFDAPLTVSGWDIGRGRPKYPRRAVPGGATYFYEVTEPTKAISDIVDEIHCGKSVSSEFQELGFGLALCGCWSRQPGEIHQAE